MTASPRSGRWTVRRAQTLRSWANQTLAYLSMFSIAFLLAGCLSAVKGRANAMWLERLSILTCGREVAPSASHVISQTVIAAGGSRLVMLGGGRATAQSQRHSQELAELQRSRRTQVLCCAHGVPDCHSFVFMRLPQDEGSRIALWAHATIARLLAARLSAGLDPFLRENQYGFRPGRSTNEAVFLIRRLQDLVAKRNQALFLLFLDWSKAFDTINPEALHLALIDA